MEKILKEKRWIALLCVLLLLSVIFGIIQTRRVKRLEYARSLEYNRVFSELTEYVDDLEISLLKGQIVSTPKQMTKLAADLYEQASGAKANLLLLPLKGQQMEKTSEFLSQVGEYASTISEKMLHGEKINEKEIKTMQQLTEYARKLKGGFDELLIGVNDGTITLEEEKRLLKSLMQGGKSTMKTELEKMEKEFHNYPSLIYDGPFSHHLSLRKSSMLEGKPEISEKQAIKYAKKFTKDEKVTVGTIGGNLPGYSVRGESTTVEFTKNGGVLLMLLRDRHVDEEKLGIEDARVKAEMFLRDNGFIDMRESYYEKREGSVIINYAYSQDGYTVFPDLAKVKIALDNGEVLGFESMGYVMNHTYRNIPREVISEEDALKNVNEALKIKGVSKAVIPLESGKEAFCYQIKGIVSDKHFLMYVNTQTGVCEDVQILLESENGILAV